MATGAKIVIFLDQRSKRLETSKSDSVASATSRLTPTASQNAVCLGIYFPLPLYQGTREGRIARGAGQTKRWSASRSNGQVKREWNGREKARE